MSHISLDQARLAIAATLTKSRDLSLKPLTVAVLDAGGHLIALEREDGASNLRPAIATGKASGALALGVSSRRIGEMAIERPTFIAALGSIFDAGIIPAAGGVLIADAGGRIVGAIGVTGDTSDNDEICALQGASAAGLSVKS